MTVRDEIHDELQQLLAERNVPLKGPLRGDTPLLDTGLDSLGFAVLVVRLEERLGYDPFMALANAIYPRTVDEFVGVYEAYGDLGAR